MEFDIINIKGRVPDLVKSSIPDTNITKIEDVPHGVQNPVFIARVEQGSDLVVRIFNPVSGDWKPRKEEVVYRLLKDNGISVPTILKTDITKSLIPFNYVISNRLDGSVMSDIYDSLTQEEKVVLYKEFGQIVGRIHSITFDRFGDVEERDDKVVVGPAHEITDVSDTLNSGPFGIWKDMHDEIVKARLHYFKGSAFEDLITTIEKYFQENIHLIDYDVVARLLHMDLHRGNIFINRNHINGIIDVEGAMVGHNEYDLMRIELAHFQDKDGEMLRKAFLEGYTPVVPLDKGYEARRPLYKLSRTLVQANCLILLGEKYSSKLEEDIASARELIKELTK